jgi:hypothetical protein
MSVLNLDPAKNGYFQRYNESSKNVTLVVEFLTQRFKIIFLQIIKTTQKGHAKTVTFAFV